MSNGEGAGDGADEEAVDLLLGGLGLSFLGNTAGSSRDPAFATHARPWVRAEHHVQAFANGEMQPNIHAKLVLLEVPEELLAGPRNEVGPGSNNETTDAAAQRHMRLYEEKLAPEVAVSQNPQVFWKIVMAWLGRFYVYHNKSFLADFWTQRLGEHVEEVKQAAAAEEAEPQMNYANTATIESPSRRTVNLWTFL